MIASTTSSVFWNCVGIGRYSRGWLGLLPLPSELGFTRVRHFSVAEVGYIRLRLGEGCGEGFRSMSPAGIPLTPTLSPSGERERTERAEPLWAMSGYSS